MRNSFIRILIVGGTALLLAVVLYRLPPVHSRLSWRIDNARAGIKYALNPPDQAVFVPGQQASQFTPTPSPSATAGPTLVRTTPTVAPSAAPTITPTAIPAALTLPDVIYVDQHGRWNYCGIANLAMALRFWGWNGEQGNTLDIRDQIAAVVKPGKDDVSLNLIDRGKSDKNVMPLELVNYVANHTDDNIALRYGGDLDLLKRLIAGGFPVVVEKGYFEKDTTGTVTWMGHYLFTTGYDDAQGTFLVQDSYRIPGKNMQVKYQDYLDGWRAFDYLFYVVYPPEREAEVYAILGDWGDPNWASQHALDIADGEVETETGLDLYFAWFNQGTSAVNLLQYGEAADAYDQAFAIYATLPEKVDGHPYRPYRMLWYQTGPYKAYYYTGRYQDVIDLANTTLYSTISTPDLEESLYWKALAEDDLGQHDAAVSDMRSALYLNHNFAAAYDALTQMGATP